MIPERSVRQVYDLLRLNFAIYPGVFEFRSAPFLDRYYEAMRARRGPVRIAFNAIFWAVFQIVILIRARKVGRKWNWDQARCKQAIRICNARFVDPQDIALYDIRQADALDEFMRRFEHIGVGRAIANPDTDHDPAITDKRTFYAICEEHNLPHPRVIAERASDSGWKVKGALPGTPLIVKPERGSGGEGVSAIDLPSTGRSDIEQHLDRLYPAGDWLAQELSTVHEDLADIACDALPTVRITTILNESNDPELVTAVLRLPAASGVIVDNAHAGGICCAVDWDTGTLAKARKSSGPGEYDRHPVTGARITGRSVPDWKALKDLAIHTHRDHFALHTQIGWDIAATSRGPALIEANARPNVRIAQRATMRGIGTTRHGELIRFHLERRTGEKRRLLTRA